MNTLNVTIWIASPTFYTTHTWKRGVTSREVKSKATVDILIAQDKTEIPEINQQENIKKNEHTWIHSHSVIVCTTFVQYQFSFCFVQTLGFHITEKRYFIQQWMMSYILKMCPYSTTTWADPSFLIMHVLLPMRPPLG